jgi:hypothetical protein
MDHDTRIHLPLQADKTPVPKKWQRDVFQNMRWRRAELVGAPTGERNGFDVLDIDPKGFGWYDANFDALPTTRAHQTRRDGVHLLFNHAPGLRNSRDKIAEGVDVRAEGGYCIWWPREGYAVEDWPLTDWPEWLLEEAMAACRKGQQADLGRSRDKQVGGMVGPLLGTMTQGRSLP